MPRRAELVTAEGGFARYEGGCKVLFSPLVLCMRDRVSVVPYR
jgi:hypothetical protein